MMQLYYYYFFSEVGLLIIPQTERLLAIWEIWHQSAQHRRNDDIITLDTDRRALVTEI